MRWDGARIVATPAADHALERRRGQVLRDVVGPPSSEEGVHRRRRVRGRRVQLIRRERRRAKRTRPSVREPRSELRSAAEAPPARGGDAERRHQEQRSERHAELSPPRLAAASLERVAGRLGCRGRVRASAAVGVEAASSRFARDRRPAAPASRSEDRLAHRPGAAQPARPRLAGARSASVRTAVGAAAVRAGRSGSTGPARRVRPETQPRGRRGRRPLQGRPSRRVRP